MVALGVFVGPGVKGIFVESLQGRGVGRKGAEGEISCVCVGGGGVGGEGSKVKQLLYVISYVCVVVGGGGWQKEGMWGWRGANGKD